MSAATHVVSVSAGFGPIEARRFVRELAARIEALCEERGLVVLEVASHDDDGEPRSMDIHVAGSALAALSSEVGTHALVARSEGRGRKARKRWFARVLVKEALPDEREKVHIDPRQLSITRTVAGGPGGQHVNKVATAVRVRHVPSGIAVRVTDERSQHANLRRAIERIAAMLAVQASFARRGGEAELRADKQRVERGRAVKTYRLGHRGALEIVA